MNGTQAANGTQATNGAPAVNGTQATNGVPDGAASGTEPAPVAGQPLEVQFAETIDVALETELAAELNAAPRRSSAR